MSLPPLLKIYNKFAPLPFGKKLFGYFFCMKAPYFLTIRPNIIDLKKGICIISMNQRWAVENHIKTVHAIAVCNLVEMTMGCVAEATLPQDLRWLPMGMDINYKKKAIGTLTATCNIDADKFFILDTYPGGVELPVDVKNSNGELVTSATVRLWISRKPEKKEI